MQPPTAWQNEKQTLRRQAEANRRAQPDQEALSRVICARFAGLPTYAEAATVTAYVGVRNEVRTLPFLADVLEQGKRLVVPYCVGDELELFWLRGIDELAPAPFGLLEPKAELRRLPERRIDVAQVDLVIVPGVAFDRQGGRTGHGRGYYDRLLRRARADAPLVALAFECQLFPEVPMRPHDVFMDQLITEKAIYAGRRIEEG